MRMGQKLEVEAESPRSKEYIEVMISWLLLFVRGVVCSVEVVDAVFFLLGCLDM